MLSVTTQSKTNISGYFKNYFNDLFLKKRKLVKLEIELIERVRSDWQKILWSTTTDRARAESSIKDCYRYGGLNPPHIVWVDHPLNVIKTSIERPDIGDVSDILIGEIWQSELRIQKSIDPISVKRVLTDVNPQYPLGISIEDRCNISIFDRMNDRAMRQINNIYADLMGRSITVPFQNYQTGYLSYFDYFLRIGLDIPQVQPTIELAKSCGWCWTFKNLVILTPKPSRLKLDRSRNIIGIIYNDVNILSPFH
jgi:hypothetical protein